MCGGKSSGVFVVRLCVWVLLSLVVLPSEDAGVSR